MAFQPTMFTGAFEYPLDPSQAIQPADTAGQVVFPDGSVVDASLAALYMSMYQPSVPTTVQYVESFVSLSPKTAFIES
jgi:hypothetical protein